MSKAGSFTLPNTSGCFRQNTANSAEASGGLEPEAQPSYEVESFGGVTQVILVFLV